MNLIEIVQQYQRYDPETGAFTATRTDMEYAGMLSVHYSYLSRFYDGQIAAPWKIVRGLLRIFPEASEEVRVFLSSDLPVRKGVSNDLHGSEIAS